MTQPNRHHPRSKAATPWRASLALAALLALVACGGQPTGPVGSVDAFVAALPAWDEVAPPVVENAGEPTGEAPVIDQETVDGTVYTCSTTPYSIAKNPTEMALFNPDASVLWPGALIRGGSHLSVGALELLAVSRERRAPLGISIQGGGVLGIPGGVSTIVDQPVGSTVREGINQLVVNALDSDVAVGAGASTFTSVESHSTSQTLLSLGLDARYLGAEASARLDYSKNASERTYTAYFVQRLFTIAVDLPERPSSVFADGVTGADLQALGISGSNLPLYIDSVSYGRILMYSFTSSDSRERIEAALEFSYNSPVGGVDGFAEADLQETLSEARIEVFALGGPNTGVQNLIRDGSLASYFEAPLAINQVEPISFTLRNLGDNTLAKVGDTTSYDVRTCLPVGGGLPQPQHWWPADGDTDDVVGGIDLGSLLGCVRRRLGRLRPHPALLDVRRPGRVPEQLPGAPGGPDRRPLHAERLDQPALHERRPHDRQPGRWPAPRRRLRDARLRRRPDGPPADLPAAELGLHLGRRRPVGPDRAEERLVARGGRLRQHRRRRPPGLRQRQPSGRRGGVGQLRPVDAAPGHRPDDVPRRLERAGGRRHRQLVPPLPLQRLDRRADGLRPRAHRPRGPGDVPELRALRALRLG
jgi:hypothetical protein